MHLRSCTLIVFVLFLSSCASAVHTIQPQLQGYLVNQNYQAAVHALDKGPAAYGSRNELLYWLDRGYVLHLAGSYKESISAFENAKRLYAALYGHTAGEVAGSALINDYWKSYRGEDYEFILINIFQALNYAALGSIDESLADIRNLDYQLKLINARYTKDNPNVYRDDAFARLLGGVFYEAEGSSDGLNNAYISDVKSLKIYQNDYLNKYGTPTPRVLKQNTLTAARFMGMTEYLKYQHAFPDIPFLSHEEKTNKAQVYVIEYTGYVPVKVEDFIVIPFDATHIAKIAFPKFALRPTSTTSSVISASSAPGIEINAPTDVGEDIGVIAQKVLENRKGWLVAKGLLRPGIKYALEKTAEEQLKQHDDPGWAAVINIVGDIFNIVSEKADLRSWETLPSEIRIGYLLLDPGKYTISVKDYSDGAGLLEERKLAEIDLKAGDKKFLISRGYR